MPKKEVTMKNCLVTTHPEIVKAWWHETLNELSPSDITHGTHKEVWLQCPVKEDHVWLARPQYVIRGRGCPFCAGKRVCESNCLATVCPDIAAQWHPTLNGETTPKDVTSGQNKEKFWWQCPVEEDHIWDDTISHRVSGNRGCPFCAGKRVCESNCLATTHPDIAAQWHPTLNGETTPDDVTAGCNTKFWMQCPVEEDHIWESDIWQLTKNGCPCCSGYKVVPSNCLATVYPEIAAQWHPTLNGETTPKDVYKSTTRRFWWQCPVASDHVYETSVANKVVSGCPCCAGRIAVPSNCLATTHPEIAAQWHPTLNGETTPNDVTAGCNTRFWWHCSKCQRNWRVSVGNRTHADRDCPRCGLSKGEKAITQHLNFCGLKEHEDFIPQFVTKMDKPDFILPKLKYLIEYNGHQHYYPVTFGSKERHAGQHNLLNCIRRDNRKLQRSLIKGWPLLIIPYWDYNRITEILDDVLAGRTPTFSEPPKIVKKHEPLRKKIRDHLGITEPEVLCGLIKPELKEKVA